MSNYAYSLELKRQISAQEAHNLSLEGKLSDKRAFKCINEDCEVPLTCANWGKVDAERMYFKVSRNNQLHTEECEYHSIYNSVVYDTEVEKIKNGGIITIAQVANKEPDSIRKKSQSLLEEQNATNNMRVNSIERIYNLYKNPDVPKDIECIKVDGKLYTFNNFFTEIEERVDLNKLRVFYGDARIFTDKGNSDFVYVGFKNYSNGFIHLSKNAFAMSNQKNILDDYIDTSKYVKTYFMGMCVKKREKIAKSKDNYFMGHSDNVITTNCVFEYDM